MSRFALTLALVVITLGSLGCARRNRTTQNIHDMGATDTGVVDMSMTDVGPTDAPAVDLTTSGDGSMGGTVHMTSTPALAIPDSPEAGVTDSMSIRSLCAIAALRVSVDITHTYIGDLTVVVQGSTCAPITLHNRSGSSADNILGVYPTTLAVDGPGALSDCVGDAAGGEWSLTITDGSGGDTGILNSWTIDIDCIE